MSRTEQAALVAWVNSFRPSKRVTAFEQLSDGRAFAEVLTSMWVTYLGIILHTRLYHSPADHVVMVHTSKDQQRGVQEQVRALIIGC